VSSLPPISVAQSAGKVSVANDHRGTPDTPPPSPWPLQRNLLGGELVWYECACGTVVPERLTHCSEGVVSAVRKQCRECGSRDVLPNGTHCGKAARPLWLVCGMCGERCNPDGTHCLGAVGLNQNLTEVTGRLGGAPDPRTRAQCPAYWHHRLCRVALGVFCVLCSVFSRI
jgi:hypothetical protein